MLFVGGFVEGQRVFCVSMTCPHAAENGHREAGDCGGGTIPHVGNRGAVIGVSTSIRDSKWEPLANLYEWNRRGVCN